VSFKHGKTEGLCVAYHENGKLFEIGSYKNGKLNGRWEQCSEDGEILGHGNFIEGVGMWKGFDEQGRITRTSYFVYDEEDEDDFTLPGIFFGDGLLEIMSESYYESGKLKSRTYYPVAEGYRHKKGEIENREMYYENGNLQYRISYRNDEQYGVWEFYHEHGVLAEWYAYKDGEYHGEQYQYRKDGRMIVRSND